MDAQFRGKRLTIFIGEYDRYHHRSLAHAIVERARQEGLVTMEDAEIRLFPGPRG